MKIGDDCNELDKFIDDFLHQGGRACRDLHRLEAFNDLFLLVGEFNLMETVQRFLIDQVSFTSMLSNFC